MKNIVALDMNRRAAILTKAKPLLCLFLEYRHIERRN